MIASDEVIAIDNRPYAATLRYLLFFITTVSLLGQLFIIFTYRSIRNNKNKFYGYVAMHSVLGLPWELANYFNLLAQQDADACGFLGFLYAFSYCAYLLWSSVIAWVIYSSLRNKAQLYNLDFKYVIGVYLASFLIMIYPLCNDGFGLYVGKDISYCWFRKSGNNTLVFTLSYYSPLILTTIFNIYCYVTSVIIVRKEYSKDESRQFYRFLAFPILQLVCNSDSLVRAISVWVSGTKSGLVSVEVIHIVLHKGEGLFEAIAYMLNPQVRKDVQKVWCTKRNKYPNGIRASEMMINGSSIENELNERSLRNQKLMDSF